MIGVGRPIHGGKPKSCLSQSHMVEASLRLTARSLVRLIKSVNPATHSATREAQQLHSVISKAGFISNEFISSALISLYSGVGCIGSARQLFDEIPHPGLVSSTAMVRAYSIMSYPMEALDLFRHMISASIMPDPVALATSISACRQLGHSGLAKMIHGFALCCGIQIDAFVSIELLRIYADHGELELARKLFDEMPTRTLVAWNAIIHQYVKHDLIDVARQLFLEMPNRDVVSWNTLISGYSQAGHCREALVLFCDMELSSVRPNKLTLCTILAACASLGALETGMWLHAYLERNNMNFDGCLDHCLIDMYAKCGSIEKAIQVFEKIPIRRDLYSWTSVICGLALHGRADHALRLFSRMQEVGVQPDDVTLVGVLNACAHGGLVDEGCKHFHSMEEVYGLKLKIEHYGCMIDLLVRVGRLKEAFDIIVGMPMEPNVVVWGTLLSGCRVHNNVKLGEIAAMKLFVLDPCDPWVRVMLSNMYAEAHDWGGVMRLRKEMKGGEMRKAPGCSSIEMSGEVHEFLAGGNLHPQHAEIYTMLENIEAQMQIR
ncbi:pentatricopeptide repeat-containing protein At5g08510-like [Elaeis guineensis]|uniref:pentatricopeptide repeat-containing protein At5g08510-like n=1 Tax=Elaeis guineensis var. tenera TaxID=51953 RepID=UPI003C6D2EC2